MIKNIDRIEKTHRDFFDNLVAQYDIPATAWVVSKPFGKGCLNSIMCVIKTALDMGAVVDLDTGALVGHSYEHDIKNIEDAYEFVDDWVQSRWEGHRYLYIMAKFEDRYKGNEVDD